MASEFNLDEMRYRRITKAELLALLRELRTRRRA